MNKETETKLNNDKILLRSLRNDIIEASTRLSQLGLEEKQKNLSLEEKHKQVSELEKEKIEIAEKMQNDRDSVQQAKKDLENTKIRTEKELEVLNQQKKEAMSELRKLNEWNSVARDESSELKMLISELKIIEEEKKKDLQDISTVKKVLEEEREAFRLLKIDIKLEKENSDSELLLNENNLIRIKEDIEKGKQEIEFLKNSFEKLLSDKSKIEEDLRVYIKRAELKYREVFPEKEFKFLVDNY